MEVRIKICGVTMPKQAREIVALGADYIGCIIEFPKSPRSITRDRARELQGALKGSGAMLVGVVVDKPIEELIEIIEHVGLNIVQLHGIETVEYVKRLKEHGIEVWKVAPHTLRHSGLDTESSNKNTKNKDGDFWILNQVQDDGGVRLADKIVIDSKNPIHGAGGSGQLSDWEFARELVEKGYSVALSGGLIPENVQEGIKFVRSSVVDASSNLESRPGVKDMLKVGRFIHNAKSV